MYAQIDWKNLILALFAVIDFEHVLSFFKLYLLQTALAITEVITRVWPVLLLSICLGIAEVNFSFLRFSENFVAETHKT